MKRRKMKVFALVMAMVLPLFAFAQKSDGFFKVNDDYYNRGIGNDLTLQNFGLYDDPYGLGLQNFGENAPVGNGLVVLFASGFLYCIRKRKIK